jgi:hypothetical protein
MLPEVDSPPASTRSCAFGPAEGGDQTFTGFQGWGHVARAVAEASRDAESRAQASPEAGDHESATQWVALWSWLDALTHVEAGVTLARRLNLVLDDPDLIGVLGSGARRTTWGFGTTAAPRYGWSTFEALRDPAPHAGPQSASRYPLLARAVRDGRVTGRGLPRPGRRTLRLVDDDTPLGEAEQVRFGASGAVPLDHVRRPRC